MMHLLLVSIAGGTGALLRFLFETLYSSARFPWVTFAINVAGSAAAGALAGLLGGALPETLAPFAITGFLGGFTTFSAVSVATAELFRERRLWAVATITAVQFTLALCAAAAGFLLTQT